MGDVRAETWYRVRLFASRSYQFSVWPVDHEQGADAPALDLSLFSDDAGTVPASPAPILSSAELEGSTNNNGDLLPASLVFQPTVNGVYRIRILRASGGSLSHTINVAVRETTLFSPWTSKAAGFEGFVEMHNNTNAPMSVTLRAYDSAGVLQGAGLTLTLPPNATSFRTAAQIGVPVNVFAGIVLTHNGAFGAIAAALFTGCYGFEGPSSQRVGPGPSTFPSGILSSSTGSHCPPKLATRTPRCTRPSPWLFRKRTSCPICGVVWALAVVHRAVRRRESAHRAARMTFVRTVM
jgi:hypothetical protein